MKPVDQTIIDPERGDCYRAAVASILDLPLKAVPEGLQSGFVLADWLCEIGWCAIDLQVYKLRLRVERCPSAAPRVQVMCSMLYTIASEAPMAVGKSGKVVIEIDPKFKRELRAALDRDGLTMKDWFVRSAERYLATRTQTELMFRDQPARTAGEEEQ